LTVASFFGHPVSSNINNWID